jgi:predicted 3-demethylubiquinone-9 3-methyltransferase (glyoxalase superfamily)/uncharacterized protein YndB with AHSA1/START domain
MKNSLLFDFTVDKTAKTAFVTREFAAELSLVWDAFTKPEILDQWWAPAPFVAKTKYMNFEVGGRRFYAMVSPEGQERWAIQEYTSISPKTNFKFFNTFADKDENPELPGSDWDLNFSEQSGTTTVRVAIYNESLARMEKMIEMGFKEGFTMTLNYLEELLTELSQWKESKREGTPLNKVTPFLMFNDQLEAAIEFYTTTFPNSEVRNVARTGEGGPINSAEFVVGGQRFMGYNGGSYFSFSEGVSFYVDCADQDEVDEYWDKLVQAGATPTACGWIKDPFGLSWQIVPRRFTELIGDKDPKKVKAVMDAMMTMVKLDVAELERAYHEA